MANRILTVLIIVLMSNIEGFSQIDTININTHDLQMKHLKEGKNKYLVYIERPDGVVMDMSIWEREIVFSKFKNEQSINIIQNWKNQDTAKTRYIYSINKRENFEPLYHYAKSGTGKIDAFNFASNKIVAADSVTNNSKADFKVDLQTATLNWELDLEVFQTLPFAEGKTFRINFYHPGSKSLPKYYEYKVEGQETLTTVNNKSIDCWLLKIEYAPKSSATFWINKTTRDVVKMTEVFNQIKRYKVKF